MISCALSKQELQETQVLGMQAGPIYWLSLGYVAPPWLVPGAPWDSGLQNVHPSLGTMRLEGKVCELPKLIHK